MIGEVLAGLSTVSSLFGSLKSAQANRKESSQIRRRQNSLDNWYNKEYNTNYLDTEEARSTVELLNRQAEKARQRVSQNNAIRGASDEARVATAEAINENTADATTQLAGYGTRYKDGIRREYQGQKARLDDLEQQNLREKSANWANFMSNATNAAVGFAEAGGMGAFDKWDGKISNLLNPAKRKSSIAALAGGPIHKVPTRGLKIPTLGKSYPGIR